MIKKFKKRKFSHCKGSQEIGRNVPNIFARFHHSRFNGGLFSSLTLLELLFPSRVSQLSISDKVNELARISANDRRTKAFPKEGSPIRTNWIPSTVSSFTSAFPLFCTSFSSQLNIFTFIHPTGRQSTSYGSNPSNLAAQTRAFT